MSLHDMIKQAQRAAINNAPIILTAIGVTGTLTTAYLTGKASFKASRILDLEKRQISLDHIVLDIDVKTSVKLVWKLYLPAAFTGAVTVACIVCANRIGNRRAAAVAAALTISEKAISEYKDKVIDTIGKNKEEKLRTEIAQDRVNKNPVSDQKVIMTSGGTALCMDSYTGRYFTSSMETLKKAMNDINYQIRGQDTATLTDFYYLIGLKKVKTSDEVGWDGDRPLELIFSTTISDTEHGEVPCWVMDFRVMPIYFR